MANLKSHSRGVLPRGLTLMELVVVLTILVALGAMIVPVLPNLLARTHYAKCATTIPELNKIWQQSYALNIRYADGMDSLLNQNGNSLFSALPGAGSAGGEVQASTLNAAEIDALAAIGVRNVFDMSSAGAENVTFDLSYSGQALADGGGVAELNIAGASVPSLNLKRHLDEPGENVRYLVFGVGPNCTAVGPGKMMVEAPVHFGGEDAMNPARFYQRYCVIFSVNGDEPARFECACSVHPTGFDGGEAHQQSFYEATNNEG